MNTLMALHASNGTLLTIVLVIVIIVGILWVVGRFR
jgi:hypothetical protein